MSHPGVGLDKWEDLPKAKPVYVGAGAINTFYAWLRLVYGFKDENIRPYNFNSAPFMNNKMSIQQGYVTAEPYEIERQGGFKPNIFLLSDYGYSTYSTLIETRRDIVEKNPDLVQRFVDASAIGWYHYLYGDNSKANAMDQGLKIRTSPTTQIAFSIAEMKEHGVVDSGDTLKLGIGAMTDARWKDFFDKMVEVGMVDGEHRLQKGLHPAVRRQGGGAQSPSSMIASRRSVIIGLAIAAVGSLWPGLDGLGSAGFPATFSFRGKASPSTRRFSHFVTSMTAPVASGWSVWPGGACTHWKAPPSHGARKQRSFATVW